MTSGHAHHPADRRPTRRTLLALVGGAAVSSVAAYGALSGRPAGPQPPGGGASPATLPSLPPYQPVPGEVFPNAKTVAARFLESLTTYQPGDDPATVVDRALLSVAAPTVDRAVVQERATPLLLPDAQASGQVVYPQLGGLVPLGGGATYAVVMAVLRHRQLVDDGEERLVTRTVEVRLRVVDGQWKVEELGSVGGDPVPRPARLAAAAQRVLDDPRIDLPDSGRWDIHADKIDGRVLTTMAALAERAPYSVTVISNGHPYNVVDGLGDRVSNHTLGRAVDVWALDGTPVVQQRGSRDTLAYEVLEQLLVPGPADEVGVPNGWDLDGPVRRLFDNAVHDDHFHIGFRTGSEPTP